MYEMTMCNMKGAAHSDELTENNPPTAVPLSDTELFSIFQFNFIRQLTQLPQMDKRWIIAASHLMATRD